ncbi:MAG TPA: alanine racemase [Gaiellaceae bacterium]|nr:alanine racemase [Gaiellaceae bacterium]
MAEAPRSEITIDRAALRSNLRRLREVLGGSELWAVVKANAYGHGAATVARTAIEEGAAALCVATIEEGLELRALEPEARIVVLGGAAASGARAAREARLELGVSAAPFPEGIPLHVKVDTGMGRWGFQGDFASTVDVVSLMSHFASADSDPAFTELQIARFAAIAAAHPELTRHLANSAGILRFPASHLDAGRAGIAMYGISPFGGDLAGDGLQPVLSWRSSIALVKRLAPGESTGYGRRFVATEPTWIGIVPVGYADGFRRGLTGTRVLVDGARRPVVGTISMDALAVELAAPVEPGTPVTLIGDGLVIEEHAAHLGTIGYELACGIDSSSERATRKVL